MAYLSYGGGGEDGGLRGGVDGRRRHCTGRSLRRRTHHLVQQGDRAIPVAYSTVNLYTAEHIPILTMIEFGLQFNAD